METGTSGLQLRVRDLVRKLRPDRVRCQLRLLLDQRWPPSTLQSVVVDRAEPAGQTPCADLTAEQPMSSQLAVALSEEERGRNGSVRPSELSLVVGGGLVPPSPSVTPRNKSPVTVQEWVDSLPLTPTDVSRGEEEGEPRVVISQDSDDNLTLGAEAGLMCGPLPPAVQVTSCKEPSESGSHCSSVESLLEARKPDPEEVLLSLGFGGGSQSSECRIPQRFLKPSNLRGVAIDDFLRQQHEMVQNFETGFCGYRGLSVVSKSMSPSHTMPSVIVAKIMEKLREHERESCSVVSPPLASTKTDRNKFSRVARNVLTKIRCVPGSSVLTPDNRKWLDSQGHKSPEIGRKRIIIGHQSFTFSGDGDLIESHSPPSSLTDSDRWTSSTGTPGQHKMELSLDKPGFPSIQEDLTEPPLPSPPPLATPRHAFANVVTSLLAEKHQESKLSSSSVEVSDEDKQWSRSLGDSGLPSSGRSSRECDSPVNLADEPSHTTIADHLDSIHEEAKPSENISDVPQLSATDGSEVCEKVNTDSFSENVKPSNSLHSERSDDSKELSETSNNSLELVFDKTETILEDSNSLDSLPASSEHSDEGKKSFEDQYKNSFEFHCEKTKPILEDSSIDLENLPQSSARLPSPKTSTPLSSPWPSLASELETATQSAELATAPVKVIESLDKVIQSLEKIMEPLEVITESDFHLECATRPHSDRGKVLASFEDLKRLVEQLAEVGLPLDIGSADQFLSLTIHERCSVQCRVLRQALSVYQSQLALDTAHYQLQSCLDTEVNRLSDLLDTAADPDKLSTLVQQMSELLMHQAELNCQLREWSGERAQTCHAVCEVVLRRLRTLEHIVCRNTHALADLRNHL